MDNFVFAVENIEKSDDKIVRLRARESELVNIIDGITRLSQIPDWNIVKSSIFDQTVSSLEKQLKMESEKSELDLPKIYRLQGKLEIARKYDDLNLESFRKELQNVRLQIKNN